MLKVFNIETLLFQSHFLVKVGDHNVQLLVFNSAHELLFIHNFDGPNLAMLWIHQPILAITKNSYQ